MTYTEEHKDLFTVSDDYYLAHCISSDFAMGAGIAVEFVSRFDMRNKLRKAYPSKNLEERVGKALLIGRTFNLITKKYVYHKPYYDDLCSSLMDMKRQMQELSIKKLAMPKIGCGIDGLDWHKVKKIIAEVFGDTDVEILICYL